MADCSIRVQRPVASVLRRDARDRGDASTSGPIATDAGVLDAEVLDAEVLDADPALVAAARLTARLTAAVIVASGLAVLAGWWFDLPALRSLGFAGIPMAPNTASSLILLGISLRLSCAGSACAERVSGGAARALAAVVLGLAALTLFQSTTGRDLGVDGVLGFRCTEASGTPVPGRMAPTTALCLMLLAGTLVRKRSDQDEGRPAMAFETCAALLAGSIALVAGLGYLYEIANWFGPSDATPMAANTAGCLLLLSLGVLAARPRQGIGRLVTSSSQGGTLARRLLPAAVVVPCILGWLGLLAFHSRLLGAELSCATLVVANVLLFAFLTLQSSWTIHELDRARLTTERERQRADRQLALSQAATIESTNQLNLALERRTAELEGANARIRSDTAALAVANQELQAFGYSVSHDLRAPLRGIDGFSQALLEDYPDKLDARGQDCLRRIRSGCQRMAHLIDDMLRLSRITGADMQREEVDLSALVRRIADDLSSAQQERQVEFVIDPGLRAQGDAKLVEVLVQNLLENAWKFTGKRARARIHFGRTEDHGRPEFFVQDDGAGFDMAYAERLFGPFQRLHAAAEFTGTGIGLATAQRVVHRHGGRIRAVGAVDRGATVYFTL